MTPRMERIGGAELWLGDCRDLLPGLDRVDGILTDPPYGVRAEEWDDMGDAEFARFSMSWLALARPLADELLVFSTQSGPVRTLAEMLYPRVRLLIWNKPPGSQLAGAKEANVWYAFEPIYHCHARQSQTVVEPKSLRLAGLIRAARERVGISRSAVDIAIRGKKTGLCFRWEEAACLPNAEQVVALRELLDLGPEFDEALQEARVQRDRTLQLLSCAASGLAADKMDVYTHRTVTCGEHPTQKPVPLIVDLLESVGQGWGSILDPFMGSGTTGVACVRLGRRFTGVERDPAHFATACRRIEAAHRQADLFVERPAPKPEQAALDLSGAAA